MFDKTLEYIRLNPAMAVFVTKSGEGVNLILVSDYNGKSGPLAPTTGDT